MEILNQPEKPANAEVHVMLSRAELIQIIHDIETGDAGDRDLAYSVTNSFMDYLKGL